MDFKRLKYFRAVVEAGSITRAALVLNVAQPALSRRLRELEEEIGTTLLLRGGRHLVPTEAGYYLYKQAGEILLQVSEAAKQTSSIGQHKTKQIRIGLTHLYQKYFARLILQLHEVNPGLEIGVSLSDSSHLELLLANRQIDLALIQRPGDDRTFNCIDLPPVRIVAVAASRLEVFAGKKRISFSALDGIPLVLLKRAAGHGTYERLLDQFRSQGLTPREVMHVSQPGAIIEWLQAGLQAVALLPASEVDPARLERCRMIEVTAAPQVFSPAIVGLSATGFPREFLPLIDHAAELVAPTVAG